MVVPLTYRSYSIFYEETGSIAPLQVSYFLLEEFFDFCKEILIHNLVLLSNTSRDSLPS